MWRYKGESGQLILGEVKQGDWPTCDGSLCSMEGRTSLVCSEAFILGTILAVYTLPITVLGGILTSQADKFPNQDGDPHKH